MFWLQTIRNRTAEPDADDVKWYTPVQTRCTSQLDWVKDGFKTRRLFGTTPWRINIKGIIPRRPKCWIVGPVKLLIYWGVFFLWRHHIAKREAAWETNDSTDLHAVICKLLVSLHDRPQWVLRFYLHRKSFPIYILCVFHCVEYLKLGRALYSPVDHNDKIYKTPDH